MQSLARQRVRAPKVKTGCATCKIRHVKCDEEKPACRRCTSTGRKCDGYKTVPSIIAKDKFSIAGKTSILSPGLSFSIGGDVQERRAFHFFCNRTAIDMCGYIHTSFWSNELLQACHSDPAIMHAVVALGSLHESFEEGGPACLEISLVDRQFPLSQSNKAIGYLSGAISQGATRSGEVILMCCLLFICLETFQGNYSSGLTHLESGMRILNSLHVRNRHAIFDAGTITYPSRSFINEITPLFLRLDLQSSLYLQARPIHYDLVVADPDAIASPAIPKAFTSLEEANRSLNDQLYWLLHYEHVAKEYIKEARNNPTFEAPDGLLGMFLAAHKDQCVQFDEWLAVLNAFLADSTSAMAVKELRGAILLKIHYLTCRIVLEESLFDDELDFDRFDDDFRRLVVLAESLIKVPVANEPLPIKPIYSVDMGVVPCLYFTACKCRDPQIRRRALVLLRAEPRREGAWDSSAAAAIATWVIGMEEALLQPITTSQDIPLSARISTRGRDFASAKRQCRIQFFQGKLNEGFGLREQWVSW